MFITGLFADIIALDRNGFCILMTHKVNVAVRNHKKVGKGGCKKRYAGTSVKNAIYIYLPRKQDENVFNKEKEDNWRSEANQKYLIPLFCQDIKNIKVNSFY